MQSHSQDQGKNLLCGQHGEIKIGRVAHLHGPANNLNQHEFVEGVGPLAHLGDGKLGSLLDIWVIQIIQGLWRPQQRKDGCTRPQDAQENKKLLSAFHDLTLNLW